MRPNFPRELNATLTLSDAYHSFTCCARVCLCVCKFAHTRAIISVYKSENARSQPNHQSQPAIASQPAISNPKYDANGFGIQHIASGSCHRLNFFSGTRNSGAHRWCCRFRHMEEEGWGGVETVGRSVHATLPKEQCAGGAGGTETRYNFRKQHWANTHTQWVFRQYTA